MAILESIEIEAAIAAVMSGDQNSQYVLDSTYPGWGIDRTNGTARLDVPGFFVQESWFAGYEDGLDTYAVPLVGVLNAYQIRQRGWRFWSDALF